ncbi:MAG TPA: hypothetical protein VNP71_09785 [Thermoplasmata archaeon]|nr:hypothetical protein [Thermoplasmata archaeon]
MNISSAAILAGVAVDAWLVAFIAIRGRRPWLQATYAACSLAYLSLGAAFVGTNEGVLTALRNDVALGILLLSHALTAILVLGLIHGETLPRRRSVAFLLLIPVPLLAYLAPIKGWTAAAAYEGNVLGGFLVVCLGIALAETVYARYSSRLLAAHSFWLGVGVIALIVAGPVYTYELEFLGATALAGANLASPIALACFALVAIQADPFPMAPHPSKGPAKPGTLPASDAIVFEEIRPKYALRTAHEESSGGRPTLILGRTPPAMAASGAGFAAILPVRHASLRALTTTSEFLAGSHGGLAVIEDLAGLSALSEWPPTIEAVVRLRHVARGTGSTVIFSTSRLTDVERRALRDLRVTWWSLPDPAREIEAILTQSFGSGAVRLLASFTRAHGLRQEELTTDHVPALLDFLTRAVTELSGVVAGTAGHGLRTQLEAAASGLRSFAAQGAEEVARGKWPSRISSEAHPDLLVTAAEYWKGKEMEELFAAAELIVEDEK